MKHTPGPWRYSIDDQTIYAKSMRGDTGEFMVASIRGWGHLQYLAYGDKIQDANGKLIESAPELLDALEDIIELVEDIEGPGTDLWVSVLKAKEAIKRATE